METIDAVKDKVIAKVLKKEEKTQGGLIIPEEFSSETHAFGEVVSVGDEVAGIHRNDTIVFHVRAGQDLLINRENFKCLTFNEIYGKMREGKSEGI